MLPRRLILLLSLGINLDNDPHDPVVVVVELQDHHVACFPQDPLAVNDPVTNAKSHTLPQPRNQSLQ